MTKTMEQKSTEVKLTKEVMLQFTQNVSKNITNAEIFVGVRRITDSILLQHNQVVTNSGELYWFLINYRDDMKVKK
jgi:hypothetical protein